MKFIIIISILIFVINITICEETDKTDKTDKTDEFDPINEVPLSKRRPSHITEKHYCETCLYILGTVLKELHGKKTETDIIDVLEKMFNPVTIQDYIPDQYRLAAEHLNSMFEDEIIESLITRKTDYHAINSACYYFTKVNIV